MARDVHANGLRDWYRSVADIAAPRRSRDAFPALPMHVHRQMIHHNDKGFTMSHRSDTFSVMDSCLQNHNNAAT